MQIVKFILISLCYKSRVKVNFVGEWWWYFLWGKNRSNFLNYADKRRTVLCTYRWFHEISQLHGRLGLHFRIENIVRRSTPQYAAMVCSRSQFQSWKQNSHKFGQVEILFRNNKSESAWEFWRNYCPDFSNYSKRYGKRLHDYVNCGQISDIVNLNFLFDPKFGRC